MKEELLQLEIKEEHQQQDLEDLAVANLKLNKIMIHALNKVSLK